MPATALSDLIVLVPDRNWERGITRLLNTRFPALLTKQLSFSVVIHTERDPGIINTGPELLRGYAREFEYAIIIFDYEGSGSKHSVRETEDLLRNRLAAVGFNSGTEVFAVNPEIENWVWGNYNTILSTLDLPFTRTDLIAFLIQEGYLASAVDNYSTSNPKPIRPKEAFEAVLREARRPRSSSLYEDLAEALSVERCQDSAFIAFRNQLRLWFPQTGN